VLRINDSIVSSNFIFSLDDTTELVDSPNAWKLSTDNTLWLNGEVGKHFVRGKTEIPLPDSTYWEKWEFECEIIK